MIFVYLGFMASPQCSIQQGLISYLFLQSYHVMCSWWLSWVALKCVETFWRDTKFVYDNALMDGWISLLSPISPRLTIHGRLSKGFDCEFKTLVSKFVRRLEIQLVCFGNRYTAMYWRRQLCRNVGKSKHKTPQTSLCKQSQLMPCSASMIYNSSSTKTYLLDIEPQPRSWCMNGYIWKTLYWKHHDPHSAIVMLGDGPV